MGQVQATLPGGAVELSGLPEKSQGRREAWRWPQVQTAESWGKVET